MQDLASLQADLRLFRERVATLESSDAELREHLCSVEFQIAPRHLFGSKENIFQTWWMRIPVIRLFVLQERLAKDREAIDSAFANFRSRLYDLYCLVEVLRLRGASEPRNTFGPLIK
jgi:hypothetical protein